VDVQRRNDQSVTFVLYLAHPLSQLARVAVIDER
jgi:hypothetical protein